MTHIKQNIVLTVKLSFLLVVLGLLIGHGLGQNALEGISHGPCFSSKAQSANVICIDGIDTQGDIAQLSGLTTINGDLFIEETTLTSLEFLGNITDITGTLTIKHNPNITTISSVSTLAQVNTLRIDSNNSLVNLRGLNSLTTVLYEVDILSNSSLLTLSDLNIGSTITSTVRISNNYSLQDLSALTNLQTAGGVAILENNLFDLSDLSSLTSVRALSIGDPNITSLAGLGSLTTVSEKLDISHNDNLLSLAGLSSLSFDNNIRIFIEYNPMLATFDGLPTVPSSIVWLTVYLNPSLTDISALSALTSVSGTITINNNALTSLSGLSNVHNLGTLRVINNENLTQLGLSSLQRIENDFMVENNTSLCEQDVTDLLNQVLTAEGVGAPGNATEGITVAGNLQICNS